MLLANPGISLPPKPLRFGMQRIGNHARAKCLNRNLYDLKIGMISILRLLFSSDAHQLYEMFSFAASRRPDEGGYPNRLKA